VSMQDLEQKAENLAYWIGSLPRDSGMLLLKLIAALPGGEALAEELSAMGEEVPSLGWAEFSSLLHVLNLVEGARDVERVAEVLLRELMPGEEEEAEEE